MNPEGISPAYLARVAQVESGGNPKAKAATSSATGLFQFTTGTWEGLMQQYPGLQLRRDGRTDPAQATRAMRQFTSDNARQFFGSVRREPTPSESYLCHFLGCGVAVRIVEADPRGPCGPVVGPAVVRANPFIKGMSCGALREWARKKVPDVLDPNAPIPPLVPRQAGSTDSLNDAELRRVTGAPPA